MGTRCMKRALAKIVEWRVVFNALRISKSALDSETNFTFQIFCNVIPVTSPNMAPRLYVMRCSRGQTLSMG